MDTIEIVKTDNVIADKILQGLVGIFETVFPNRIRGYYLEGSYADKTALYTSDIDLVILFKDSFMGAVERDTAEQISVYLNLSSSLDLDIEFLSEKEIADGVPPSLKLGSTMLYGDPIGDEFPLISVDEWGRERTHAAYWLMTKVLRQADTANYPFGYPNPDAEFYGYTERKVALADGSQVHSTRNLIRVIGWAGTALVAILGGKIVVKKKDCHILYRQHINDEWAELFELIYIRCRMEWQYLIPDDPSERDELKHICKRTLEFENHFLRVYKQFLLSELNSKNPFARADAIRVQKNIPYADNTIIRLLKKLDG